MNDWKLKVWKQKKICLRFGVSSFCLICSTVMIQSVWYRMKMLEYILILVFIISLLKTLIAFFSLSLNIISLWTFLREFLFYFHFSFSVAIRKKARKYIQTQTSKAKTDKNKKKLIAFHWAHAHMCDDCLWWLLTAFDEIRWIFFPTYHVIHNFAGIKLQMPSNRHQNTRYLNNGQEQKLSKKKTRRKKKYINRIVKMPWSSSGWFTNCALKV